MFHELGNLVYGICRVTEIRQTKIGIEANNGTTCPRPTWLGRTRYVNSEKEDYPRLVMASLKSSFESNRGSADALPHYLNFRNRLDRRRAAFKDNQLGHVAGSLVNYIGGKSSPFPGITDVILHPHGDGEMCRIRYAMFQSRPRGAFHGQMIRQRRMAGATTASARFGTDPGFLIKVSFRSAFDQVAQLELSTEEFPARRPDSEQKEACEIDADPILADSRNPPITVIFFNLVRACDR
ncbi:hypothetical protein F5888DRAFT_1632635 [Russula emetica]|nr:hypothetical protein F5888DRAFT_1632635 [Russula emetica]